MEESVIFNAREISRILEDTESVQNSNESNYTKENAKITAYDEILELIKGEQ